MLKLDSHPSGRHSLHIPSPVPARVLSAISFRTMDHRGPEFGPLGLKVRTGMQQIFKTTCHHLSVHPARVRKKQVTTC